MNNWDSNRLNIQQGGNVDPNAEGMQRYVCLELQGSQESGT